MKLRLPALLSLLLGVACTEAPGGLAPTITVNTTVGTVATASWTRTGSERTRIVLERDGQPWRTSDWQEAELSHVETLYALPASESLVARVEVETIGESDPAEFTTGPLAPGLPELSVEGEPAWGGWLWTSFVGAVSTAVLIDESGEIVWWHEVDAPRLTRVRPRADGRGIWYGYAESEAKDSGGLRSVSWTGEALADLDVPAFSHDFVLLPDDRLALIEFDRREMDDGSPVWGNRIVEADTDGLYEVVWSTFDSWEPGVDGDVDVQGYWTGVNAIDHDPDTDAYTVSARGLGAIVEVRRDGTLGTQIGGPQSDYDFPAADDIPKRQHQFQRLDDGLLVFDNRDAETGSRALELALDDTAGTATARWTWAPDPSLFVYALGDVHRRPDGSTLIAWCTAGEASHVGADDTLLSSLRLDLGAGFGFMELAESLPGVNPADH